jgi:sugar phosphate permease
MGFHGTALLMGGAASSPIAGAIIDGSGPTWAFVVAGVVGVAMVVVAFPFWRNRPARQDARAGMDAQLVTEPVSAAS